MKTVANGTMWLEWECQPMHSERQGFVYMCVQLLGL